MGGKRKRNKRGIESEQKRQKTSAKLYCNDPIAKRAILGQCYPQVFSLREYLLFKLPATSKIRRKRILHVGRNQTEEDGRDYSKLSKLLDKTLVGILHSPEISPQERIQQWISFSQRPDTSDSTFADLSGSGHFSQSEIIDFIIWMTFSKINAPSGRSQHLLCQGFRKDASARSVHRGETATSAIPGLVSIYPNNHVVAMKASPWPEILALMGKDGERMMIDLVLDCGIFIPIESGQGSYYQLSGQPLGDLPQLPESQRLCDQRPKKVANSLVEKLHYKRPLGSITFVRNRMLYARAALNAHGKVQFGLRRIRMFENSEKMVSAYRLDVLHRYPLSNLSLADVRSTQPNTLHVMMYMFPRHFNLHNVFTCEVDPKESVQPFKDYTLREDEINANFSSGVVLKLPKRLRQASNLVQKLQIQHSRCPYKILLNHYCPAWQENPSRIMKNPQSQDLNACTSTAFETQKSTAMDSETSLVLSSAQNPVRKHSMMDYATSFVKVSAFCRAVLHKLIPREFWGCGESQIQNQTAFHRNVDRFIGLRRFETLSLHEVSQGIKRQIADINWLGLPSLGNQKIAQSDFNKRKDIFHEFLYYLFDSLIIPLIRANFHVTESNTHRYRLFFFRHDVWRSLTEPATSSLKLAMFTEIHRDKAQKMLESRALGFSQVRLLPKHSGVRPIMNLRRRMVKKGSKILGPSINSVLAPIYNALSFEKTANPNRLGSTLFSVGDLYQKLKLFKSGFQGPRKPFYIAKLDVQAAFDTIPQKAVLQLMATIPSDSEYRISKHVELKPGEGWREGNSNSKPMRKWIALAKDSSNFQRFDENLESELAVGRKNIVFVENVVNQFRETDDLLALLTEHIEHNMVKIGNKFYRQKEGIPQGSVLSSLLCNYFYADLEARHLSFLQSEDSLLLRLIDDFLLITTNRSHAKRFLQIMHDGLPEYGVRVNPDKTLVNFEAIINNKKVERLVGTQRFPYCGTFIDAKSLDITRDRERRRDIYNFTVVTYDHRLRRIGHPVRSAIHKPQIGRLVVGWVTTSEYLLFFFNLPIFSTYEWILVTEDSLTVEFSRLPGQTFHRKILNAFKIQAHAMFLDTSHNALHTVLSNLYSAFSETATKLYTYNRCLPIGKQPGTKLLIKTISDLVELAYVLMKSKGRNRKNVGYQCVVKKVQVEWLAMMAFSEIMQKKQSKFSQVIAWLDAKIERLRIRENETVTRMRGIIAAAGE